MIIGIKYVFSFLFIGGPSGKMVRSFFYMQKKSVIFSQIFYYIIYNIIKFYIVI